MFKMKLFKFGLMVAIQFLLVAGVHSKEVEKLLIIGSGAAGSSAAIFAAQANLHPLVVQDVDCNAQVALIHKIDNYPGVLEEIDGIELLNTFRKQAEKFGARFVQDTVIEVDFVNRPFKIEFSSGKTVYAEAVIVAAGNTKKWLGLQNEQILRGKGVVSATFCKDTDYRGKDVVVIGGGHAALQEAIYVSNQAKNVTIINRGDKFNASKFHQNAVFNSNNIEVLYNTSVDDILDVSRNQVTGVVLRNNKDQQVEHRLTDIIIVAIGNQPNTDLFEGQLELTPSGNIVTKGKNTATNISGVFAAGDITDMSYGRVVVAAGTGAMAALDAVRYLDAASLDK